MYWCGIIGEGKPIRIGNGVPFICERTILEPVPSERAVTAFAASNWFAWNWSEDDEINDVTAGLINCTRKRTKTVRGRRKRALGREKASQSLLHERQVMYSIQRQLKKLCIENSRPEMEIPLELWCGTAWIAALAGSVLRSKFSIVLLGKLPDLLSSME